MQLNKTKEKSIEDIKKELELKKINHPFEDDLLGLKPFAETISNIVVSTKDPFVFSINSPYGTGKTFFLRRLHCLLEKKGCMCVSYNAWESDFYDNPLIALISELINNLKANSKDFENIEKEGIELSSASVGFSFLFNADINLQQKENLLNSYKNYKDLKYKFISALQKFTENLEKPLVFIIDELDRCRPDYAIKTLEVIKHFFNIPNIVFIIGVDRKQIESTVKVLYGANIDNNCDEYLRKFIDQDFYLPHNTTEQYISFLCKKHLTEILHAYAEDRHTFSVLNFENLVSPYTILPFKQKPIDVKFILDVFTINLIALSIYFNFSLRKQEQLINLIKIFISALNPETDFLFPELICYLVSIRIFEHSYLEEKNCLNIFDSQYISVIDKKYSKLQNIELIEPSHKSTFFNLQNNLKGKYQCKPVDLWQEILCSSAITGKIEAIKTFIEKNNKRIKTNADKYFELAKQLTILTTENK